MGYLEERCLVLRFYRFMGKKWTYPLLYSMRPGEKYSFEDLIHVCKREISRTILSLFLKEALELNVIVHEDHRYRLGSLGVFLQGQFSTIKGKLIEENGLGSIHCTDECVVNKLLERACFRRNQIV